MRKSLGKRLISGVTAALTAVSLFPNVLPNSMAAGETSDINSAKTIFSLDREGALKKADDVTYKYANELYAQLNFVDEAGNPAEGDRYRKHSQNAVKNRCLGICFL